MNDLTNILLLAFLGSIAGLIGGVILIFKETSLRENLETCV